MKNSNPDNTSMPGTEPNTISQDSRQLRDNPNARGGKTFHCSDVGPMSCNWTVTGNSEDEMMPEIEKHGREVHGMTKLSQKIRGRIHDAIHDRAA